jgi:hypothetical protein
MVGSNPILLSSPSAADANIEAPEKRVPVFGRQSYSCPESHPHPVCLVADRQGVSSRGKVMCPSGAAKRDMPSYFYVIKNSTIEHDDEDGTILRDDADASLHALQIIRELQEGGGYEDGGWTIVVFAGDGRRVCTVPFSTVGSPPQERKIS